MAQLKLAYASRLGAPSGGNRNEGYADSLLIELA